MNNITHLEWSYATTRGFEIYRGKVSSYRSSDRMRPMTQGRQWTLPTNAGSALPQRPVRGLARRFPPRRLFGKGSRLKWSAMRMDSDWQGEHSRQRSLLSTDDGETEFVAETLLPTRSGLFRLRGYRHSVSAFLPLICMFELLCRWMDGGRVPSRPLLSVVTSKDSPKCVLLYDVLKECVMCVCRFLFGFTTLVSLQVGQTAVDSSDINVVVQRFLGP